MLENTWSKLLTEDKMSAAIANLSEWMEHWRGMFHEMEDTIHFAMSSVLNGKPMLLIGDPGTAKSLVVENIGKAIEVTASCPTRVRAELAGPYFRVLLGKTTMPDELFGPLNIAELKEGKNVRNIKGYAPASAIVFMDEVSRGNSTVRNAMLTLMNEKAYFQNGSMKPANMLTLFGATNSVTLSAEDGAFLDRFLYKILVSPVSLRDSYHSLCGLTPPTKEQTDRAAKLRPITLREVIAMRFYIAETIEMPSEMVDLGIEVQNALRAEFKWQMSPRKFKQIFADRDTDWRKFASAAKTEAFLCGDQKVSRHHIDHVLSNSVWNTMENREAVQTAITDTVRSIVSVLSQIYNAILEGYSEIEGGKMAPNQEMDILGGMKKQIAAMKREAKAAYKDGQDDDDTKARTDSVLAEAELLLKKAATISVNRVSTMEG